MTVVVSFDQGLWKCMKTLLTWFYISILFWGSIWGKCLVFQIWACCWWWLLSNIWLLSTICMMEHWSLCCHLTLFHWRGLYFLFIYLFIREALKKLSLCKWIPDGHLRRQMSRFYLFIFVCIRFSVFIFFFNII